MTIDVVNAELNQMRIALAKATIALHAVMLTAPLSAYTKRRVEVALAAAYEALNVDPKGGF